MVIYAEAAPTVKWGVGGGRISEWSGPRRMKAWKEGRGAKLKRNYSGIEMIM